MSKEKCDTCKLRYVCTEQAEFDCKRYNYRDYYEDSQKAGEHHD